MRPIIQLHLLSPLRLLEGRPMLRSVVDDLQSNLSSSKNQTRAKMYCLNVPLTVPVRHSLNNLEELDNYHEIYLQYLEIPLIVSLYYSTYLNGIKLRKLMALT